MGWLDDLLGKQFQQDGTNVPQRKTANFIGATVEDDPDNERTNVTITGGIGGGFLDAVVAKSNSGSTSYPAEDERAIGISTFVRTALADHDSVRMYGEIGDPVEARTPGTQGRVTNLTAYIVDLYPLAGESLFVDGVDQGADTPIEIPAGGTAFFLLDADGFAHFAG